MSQQDQNDQQDQPDTRDEVNDVEAHEQPERVPDEVAEEAASQARDLMENNREVSMAVTTMVAARQLYAFAVKRMDDEIDELDPSPGDMPKEVLLQAASEQAARPFSPVDLAVGMQKQVFPWFGEHVDGIRRKEQEEMEEKAEKERSIRLKTPVPLGFEVAEDRAFVERGLPVVLVGHAGACRWLVRRAIDEAVGWEPSETELWSRMTVIHLSRHHELTAASPGVHESRDKSWTDCARRSKDFPNFIVKEFGDNLEATPDLIACEDLTYANEGMSVEHPGVRAATALRRIRSYADQLECAVLGVVPTLDDKPPSLLRAEWNRLTTHAVVRPVTVHRADGQNIPEGKVEVVIGHDLCRIRLDAGLIGIDAGVRMP